MANVYDVAEYILANMGSMTAMKLQKLVYYSQAWSLVWDGKPLFDDAIEAWANGPVCRALYDAHRGMFNVSPGLFGGDPSKLDTDEQETVAAVIRDYGGKTPHWLSELTHSERPWKESREGLAPGQRGSRDISHELMHDYYAGL